MGSDFYWDEGNKKGSSINATIVLGIVLIVIVAFTILQTLNFNQALEKRIAESEEANILPVISIIRLGADCDDCFSVEPVIADLARNVNITSDTSVNYDSQEGKELVSQYRIERIPSIIITGEVNKSNSFLNKINKIGEKRDNAYIYTDQKPPFIDGLTGLKKGLVSATILEKKDCDKCVDLTPIIEEFTRAGVVFRVQLTEDITTSNGQLLVKKFNITSAPALVFDKELATYSQIVDNWDQVGSIEQDGSYVIRSQSSPYYSIDESRIVGLVDITILKDSTCTECYDGRQFHRAVLQRMGVYVSEENEVEISSQEGKELLARYNITQVPTVILQGDMREYESLVRAWGSVGSAEEDGSYIFRRVDVARQPYKDLDKGVVVSPVPTTPPPT